MTAYHDTNLDPSMRPEKYESISKAPTTAWGKNSNGVPSAWGQQSKERGKNKKDFFYYIIILFNNN